MASGSGSVDGGSFQQFQSNIAKRAWNRGLLRRGTTQQQMQNKIPSSWVMSDPSMPTIKRHLGSLVKSDGHMDLSRIVADEIQTARTTIQLDPNQPYRLKSAVKDGVRRAVKTYNPAAAFHTDALVNLLDACFEAGERSLMAGYLEQSDDFRGLIPFSEILGLIYKVIKWVFDDVLKWVEKHSIEPKPLNPSKLTAHPLSPDFEQLSRSIVGYKISHDMQVYLRRTRAVTCSDAVKTVCTNAAFQASVMFGHPTYDKMRDAMILVLRANTILDSSGVPSPPIVKKPRYDSDVPVVDPDLLSFQIDLDPTVSDDSGAMVDPSSKISLYIDVTTGEATLTRDGDDVGTSQGATLVTTEDSAKYLVDKCPQFATPTESSNLNIYCQLAVCSPTEGGIAKQSGPVTVMQASCGTDCPVCGNPGPHYHAAVITRTYNTN